MRSGSPSGLPGVGVREGGVGGATPHDSNPGRDRRGGEVQISALVSMRIGALAQSYDAKRRRVEGYLHARRRMRRSAGCIRASSGTWTSSTRRIGRNWTPSGRWQ